MSEDPKRNTSGDGRAGPGVHTAAYRRVGIFAVVLLLVGAIVSVLGVLPLEDQARPFAIPWFILAGLFYATEVKVVHVHFRREAQAFSLNELPLIAGLYFVSPQELLGAALLGGVSALVIARRQRGVKLAINAGHILLGTALAVYTFHSLVGQVGNPSAYDWVLAALAAIIAALVNSLAIFVAIALSEGRAEFSNIPQIVTSSMVATLTSTSLALIAVSLMWVVPEAAVLLVIPVASLFLAFRAYTAEKEKHESLEFLYQSSRILQEAPEVSSAVTNLLREARRTFRSEVAEVVLFPADPSDPVLRTTVGPGDTESEMESLEWTVPLRSFVGGVRRGRAHVVNPGAPDGVEYQTYLADRGYRDGMVVPLRGETRVIGAMLLADRLGQVSPFRVEELRLFETLANNASVSLENTRLERTLTELNELKDELRHRAYHDSLTGLANRALFSQRVDEAVTAANSVHEPAPGSVALLYLDLDDFKTVNDTLGHDAGDELLIEVAERLRQCIRPHDLAARLGGDEFAVLIEGPTSRDLPENLAERIIGALRYPVSISGKDIIVRSSIGIALHEDGASASDLIRNADIAMYRAKHHTKGRYAVYQEGMADAVSDRLELRNQLLQGVESQDFVLHYQPLYDLASEAIVGFEALVRWQHPERGLVAPDDFIALAEETGLVLPMGDQVIRSACAQLAEWQENHHAPGLVMTINISARQLKHDSLIRTVSDAIRTSGLRPGSIVLEITERDVMDDTDVNLERLAALKTLGVQLAIDDFGTGYSSLAYLRRFPMDIVKIAKPFIDGITQVGDGGVLARAIIELSRALSLRTIAEGVETPEQLDRLRDWNAQIGQGWLFSKAVSAADADRLLARDHRGARRPTLRAVTDDAAGELGSA